MFFSIIYFKNILNLTGVDSDPHNMIVTQGERELEKSLIQWMRKKFGFHVEGIIPYIDEQKVTVRDVLDANNRWDEMNRLMKK
jgi:hypothetical protein